MGQFTINTTSAQDQRILDAFQDRYGEEFGGAQVKQWLIDQLKAVVRGYETRVANEAASAAVTDIDPA